MPERCSGQVPPTNHTKLTEAIRAYGVERMEALRERYGDNVPAYAQGKSLFEVCSNCGYCRSHMLTGGPAPIACPQCHTDAPEISVVISIVLKRGTEVYDA